MTLNLRMVLEMESAAARAELETAARGIKGVTAATGELAGASKSSAAAANTDAAAKNRSAQASRTLQAANTSAAGATGNLVAQFQDIGVMMAAGQNPLQLAIQQGSQISQVIGQAGATGAVQLLRGAFLSLLSPVNLITIGSIAAGAAMVQWLSSASDEAAAFSDSVADLADQADTYVQAIDRARGSTAALRKEFGDASAEVRTLLKELAEYELRKTLRATPTRSEELRTELQLFDGAEFAASNQFMLADFFDLSAWQFKAQGQINAVLQAFRRLESEATLDGQIAAAEELKAALQSAANAAGGVTEEEDALLAKVTEIVLSLVRVREAQEGTTREVEVTTEAAESLNTTVGDILEGLGLISTTDISGVFSAAKGAANGLLVVVGKVLAEMSVLGQQAAAQAQLAQMKIEFSPGGQNLLAYGSRQPGGTTEQNSLERRNRPSVRAGSGTGASAARQEADALQQLIQGLEDEIAILREQDPIQKEMLRHREALAGATEAERQKVEELIATREREQLLMEGAKARAEFFENVGLEALEALIVKGESFNDVLKNIAASLINAALQAAIFGQGPFGSLFGGKSILSGLIPGITGKAEGGMVHGPGTGTSDSILTALSNGEYVVNARATARNRHLLEAINAGGRIGGFAEGGFVGDEGRRAGRNGGRDLPGTVVFDLRGARGNREIEEMVRKGSAQMISLYDREGLAVSVQRVSRDPRRRG